VETAPRVFRGPPPSPVVMGIVPDQDTAGPGWLIAAVMPEGAAAKAGMKDADRILSVDGKTITGLSDYYKATEKKKAGDVVAVVVRRGAEELTLQVELAARP
jgi:serine protease Do